MSSIVYGDEADEKPQHDKKINPTAVEKPLLPPDESEKPKIDYFLFYPDNPADRYHDGIYRVYLDSKEVKLKIERGVVKTSNMRIRDILIRQGFTFMYEVPREE